LVKVIAPMPNLPQPSPVEQEYAAVRNIQEQEQVVCAAGRDESNATKRGLCVKGVLSPRRQWVLVSWCRAGLQADGCRNQCHYADEETEGFDRVENFKGKRSRTATEESEGPYKEDVDCKEDIIYPAKKRVVRKDKAKVKPPDSMLYVHAD
jgi:hypothetical protein